MAQKSSFQRKSAVKQARKFASEFVRYLKAEGLTVQRAYLYGSFARGTPHRWSDIDVCIISPQFRSPSQSLRYLWEKRRDIDIKRGIEPVGYHPKDFQVIKSPLVWDIYENGIRIP